jgi:hypothetical protein
MTTGSQPTWAVGAPHKSAREHRVANQASVARHLMRAPGPLPQATAVHHPRDLAATARPGSPVADIASPHPAHPGGMPALAGRLRLPGNQKEVSLCRPQAPLLPHTYRTLPPLRDHRPRRLLYGVSSARSGGSLAPLSAPWTARRPTPRGRGPPDHRPYLRRPETTARQPVRRGRLHRYQSATTVLLRQHRRSPANPEGVLLRHLPHHHRPLPPRTAPSPPWTLRRAFAQILGYMEEARRKRKRTRKSKK